MDTLPNYLAGLLRTVLAFLAGVLVTKGVVTAEQATELVGAGLVIATAGWSLWQKRNASKKLNAASGS